MNSAWLKLKSFLILGLLLCTASQTVCVSQPLVLVRHDAFVSYYDCSVLNPAVVVWVLTPEAFQGNLKPTTRHFKTDTQLPIPRVKDSDLKGTGYVRGHLCPVGDRDSDKGLLKQTYLTSNLTPMTMVCNSGPWKAVEDSCRALAISHGRLLIAAGVVPEYCDTIVNGRKKIFVPSKFWKMAKCLNHPSEVWIWIVQNSPSWSAPVRVSRNELESVLPTAVRNTGILDNLFSLGLN